MGCICSKAIGRSMSIGEGISHGFQKANLAWEDLLAPNNGNDQRSSFHYSANTRTNELRPCSFTLPSIDDDLGAKHFVNGLDLIERTTEVKSSPDFDAELDVYGRFTRSKSYQMSREKEPSTLNFEFAEGLNENELDWREKNLRGSRSFHTVEEYDALLERIHKTNTRDTQSFEDYHSSLQLKHLVEDENGSDIIAKEFLKDEAGTEELNDLDKGGSNPMQGDNARESGWKRKAAAKELTALDVSAIEFPAIARLRQWTQVKGQIYSPGTYVTPKFGSYNHMKTKEAKEEEGVEGSVFSPEVLAAFEECVQQLQKEEDSILCHMDGYMRINNANVE